MFLVPGNKPALIVLTHGVDPPAQVVALFFWSNTLGEIEDLIRLISSIMSEVYIDELFCGGFGFVVGWEGSMNETEGLLVGVV